MNNLDPTRYPVIVAAARTAVGEAKRGSLAAANPIDMGAAVIRDLLDRAPSLDPADIDDVIIGCAMPEGEMGLNMSRQITLRAGLPDSVAAETINRFCSSGLQSIAHASMHIMSGMADVVIAGGSESMSMVPMAGNKFAPNPTLSIEAPEVYLSMGLTGENVSEQYSVSCHDQDEFSLRSHQNAANAIQENIFKDQIVPLDVEVTDLGANGKPEMHAFTFDVDEGVRFDTSLDALSKLRPVFKGRRHGDSRELFANVRWRSGRNCDVPRESKPIGPETNGSFHCICCGRCSAGDHGSWPGGGGTQGTQACWPLSGRYWLNRTQRGLRCSSFGRHPSFGIRPLHPQRQRRCGRPRSPARLYGCQAHHPTTLLNEAPRRGIWLGDDVYWRWNGRGRDI